MLRNSNSLLKCDVANPFLKQNVRYHCQIFAIFKFKPKATAFALRVWLIDTANFDLFRQSRSSTGIYLTTTTWTNGSEITTALLNLCRRFIPNRKVTIKPSEPQWVKVGIKRFILNRKRIYRKALKTSNLSNMMKFKSLLNHIVKHIKRAKQHFENTVKQLLVIRNTVWQQSIISILVFELIIIQK